MTVLEPPTYPTRVAQLVDRLARLTRELQFAGGLNPAQWEALRFIARANRYSRTPTGLAEFLGATKGTASQTLIALENKGYVTRLRDSVDRRQIVLGLTPAGEAMLADDPVSAVERAAAAMDAEMGPALVRGLSRLLHDLQHRNGTPEFGVCADCTLRCIQPVDGSLDLCGLTGETIPSDEANRICINFRGATAA